MADENSENDGAEIPPEQVVVSQVVAARRSGVTARTLYNWEKRGLISGNRAGGFKFYSVRQLDELTMGKDAAHGIA